MTYLLNIGMDIGDTKDALTMGRIMVAIGKLMPGVPVSVNTYKSGTENTAVVQMDSDEGPWSSDIDALCTELEQEAIPVYYPGSGRGFLYGPMAEAWGPFDPARFIMPDGTTLA